MLPKKFKIKDDFKPKNEKVANIFFTTHMRMNRNICIYGIKFHTTHVQKFKMMTAQKLFLHFEYLNKTGETLDSVSALKFLYEREPIISILAWTYTASCSYEYISCIYIYYYILYVRSKYKLCCR